MKAGEVIAKMFYFGNEIKLFEESPGSPMVKACWVTPSAGDREESATETYRLMLLKHGKGAKVR